LYFSGVAYPGTGKSGTLVACAPWHVPLLTCFGSALVLLWPRFCPDHAERIRHKSPLPIPLPIPFSELFMKTLFLCSFALAVIATLSANAVQALELKVDMIQLDPWTIPDPANPGQFTGLVPDVMKELEKRTGHKIVGKMTPYGRVESDLQEGVIDFSFMAWGPQRAAWANKGVAAFPLQFGVWGVKGVILKSYADLKGVKISVTRGLKVDPTFDQDGTLDKAMDLDYTTGVKKAAAGQIQAVAGSLSTIGHIVASMGVRDKFGDFLVLKTTDATVSWSKKAPSPAAEGAVNEAIGKMVQDGTMQKIYDKWLKK
jgi:polar amino acid transport system substrate-binding protein